MDSYPQHQLTTARSFTYNYNLIPPQAEKPYILFIHGFPSSVFHFRQQIKYFSDKGYGILAPDLLGYGGSSKPLDYQFYSGKGMTEDLKEILDHEKITEVLVVSHDWGSYLHSRLLNYYPSTVTKSVFLDIGYTTPGHDLTAETIRFANSMSEKYNGYPILGYFLFFDEEGAGKLMDEHIDSVEALFHSRDEEVMAKYMGAEGGARKWLEGGMTTKLPSYLTPEEQAQFRKHFSSGFAAPINWYKAQLHDVNGADDKGISEEARKLKQPTLMVCATNNISAAANFPEQMKDSVPNLEVVKSEAGHWIMMEKVDETNEMLEEFFKK